KPLSGCGQGARRRGTAVQFWVRRTPPEPQGAVRADASTCSRKERSRSRGEDRPLSYPTLQHPNLSWAALSWAALSWAALSWAAPFWVGVRGTASWAVVSVF